MLYLFLLFLCWLIFAGTAAGTYYMVSPRLLSLHDILARGVYYTLLMAVAGSGIFIIGETASLWLRRTLFPSIPIARKRALFLTLYPLCRALGGLMGRSRDDVAASCIALNNKLTMDSLSRRDGECLLVLLPRCIQRSGCGQELVRDVLSCKGCGQCDIARLVELSKKHQFRVAVVTGGELARNVVRDLSPSVVIAVACERELIQGLRDIIEIPALGIVNRRPEGPCRNTSVDMEQFESAVSTAIHGGRLSETGGNRQ
jgi:hypothetical protein